MTMPSPSLEQFRSHSQKGLESTPVLRPAVEIEPALKTLHRNAAFGIEDDERLHCEPDRVRAGLPNGPRSLGPGQGLRVGAPPLRVLGLAHRVLDPAQA